MNADATFRLVLIAGADDIQAVRRRGGSQAHSVLVINIRTAGLKGIRYRPDRLPRRRPVRHLAPRGRDGGAHARPPPRPDPFRSRPRCLAVTPKSWEFRHFAAVEWVAD